MPYYSFEGVPYAKPPVGGLRFQPPQPPDNWDGVLNADGDVPSCIQIPATDLVESEDCLYVNVYVPKPAPETALPKAVMVWIYGGGFLFGVANSTYYGPDYLLEQDVIVVHFSYRVNVFGFLSTGDSSLPGNYGLKDQLAALKWVRANIHLFGGDPDRITIFGESAGGASVQYHLVSPKSRGLFHSAISESGSTLCAWALQSDPGHFAYQIGYAAGFLGGSTRALVRYLKKLSSRQLRRAAVGAAIVNSIKLEQSLAFSPALEPEHDDAFITESSYDLLKTGDFERVPYVVGFNSEESGGARAAIEIGEPLLNMLPNDLLVPPGMNNKAKIIGDEIRKFYFDSNTKPRIQQYVDFLSDSSFYRPIVESARFYSLYAPVYMYRFAYEGYFLGKKAFSMGQESKVNGVMHAEEIWYLFRRGDLKHANDTDKMMRKRMVKLWTNFAKFSNPTPEPDALLENVTWPRYQKGDYPYLNIDHEMTVGKNFREQTMEFWRELFSKYGRPPFDTY
ncbi:unnamed protein product [Tenebrio molitor]|nr:unnamed protein product [Tenebrio molitor]